MTWSKGRSIKWSRCSRQHFYARKNESVYWKFLLDKSTVERGQTALGIPCSEILIDRPTAVVANSTVAASGRGLYATQAYKRPE